MTHCCGGGRELFQDESPIGPDKKQKNPTQLPAYRVTVTPPSSHNLSIGRIDTNRSTMHVIRTTVVSYEGDE